MGEVRIEAFAQHLAQGLSPVYLIAGEEPLLVEEALDAVRRTARAAGHDEREVLHADKQFDWARLTAASDNLSLFGGRRLIELRLPGGRPGKEGSAALKAFAGAPPPDTTLVVVTDRLEAAQRKSAWVSAIAGSGTYTYAWPLQRQAVPKWLEQRARSRGVHLDAEAVTLLADRNEGNLLAMAQEIDKLALLAGEGSLDAAAVAEAVTDSARYAIFDLPEAVLAGAVGRSRRIVERLRAEGEEPVLVLWALARDLRALVDIQAALARGERSAAVMARHRILKRRQTRFDELARALPQPRLMGLLSRAAAVDRVIKGAVPGRPWDELIVLSSRAARVAARGATTEAGA